jgi:tRNA/tmRNA/rRNA uracil-C5-methylase (TrmA/RlmC/RlmD family)
VTRRSAALSRRTQLLDLTVERAAPGGDCVAHAPDGRVVFIRGALPGEQVRVRLTDENKRLLRADTVEVLKASADRVTPPCPLAVPGRCGGCDWQHASVAAARDLKGQVLREQLVRLGGIDPGPVSVQAPRSTPDGLGWRTRVQVSVGRDGSRGLLRHRSHAVERVRHCPISHPLVEQAGAWRTDGPQAHRVAHQPRPRVAFAASATTGEVVIDDDGTLVHRALEHDFRVGGGGFWQVHPDAPQLLADAVLEALGPQPGERALDLYAGAGLFSYALGSSGVRVTAVEMVPGAAADARENCSGLDVTVQTADVADAVGTLLDVRDGPVDLVVLDPPRTGASAEIMRALAALRPRAIAYVSCDGATLARDVRAAREAGYRLQRLRAFDLFPMTAHLECLALLTPADGEAGADHP